MTRDDIARVYQLQGIDTAIAEREALLAGLDDGSSAEAELDAERGKLDALGKQLHQQRAEQRNLELELAGVEEEKQDKTDRAYGGRVSQPKELEALEKKLDELERRKGTLEDRILRLLDRIEQGEAELAQQQETTDQAASRLREITTRYEQEDQRARNELVDLAQKRAEMVPTIDAALVRQYDDLRQKLEGVAIVVVEGGLCMGCHVALPRSTEIKATRGGALVKCENCRRMLYFPLDEGQDDC